MTSSKTDISNEDLIVEVADVDQYADGITSFEMEEGNRGGINPANPTTTDEDNHNQKTPAFGRSITNGLEPSILRFQDLNFLVGSGGRPQTHILSNVSGTVHHGDVLAIMGPSGAGKLYVNVVVDQHKRDILFSSDLPIFVVS